MHSCKLRVYMYALYVCIIYDLYFHSNYVYINISLYIIYIYIIYTHRPKLYSNIKPKL